jgi:pimeloyl-ACP methyl ester carboxylesterase
VEISQQLTPPSKVLVALETRALAELAWFWQSYPLLRLAPRGDRHPVLVLPGFTASDLSTHALRFYLRRQGYSPFAWQQGRNLGLRPGLEVKMIRRLRSIYWRFGEKVSVIGWSLGGIYARELARQHPEMIRQVITLGSPFNLSTRANHAWRIYEMLSGEQMEEQEEMMVELRSPLSVPTSAIYSKSDGVVAWQCCLETESDSAENIEVPGSHCGLGHNPLAAWAIADRLALPEGEWRPFDKGRFLKSLYKTAPISAQAALSMA